MPADQNSKDEESNENIDLDDVDPSDEIIDGPDEDELFDGDESDLDADADDDAAAADDDDFEEPTSLEKVAESEEEDSDEVEADLSAILQERISADDDDEEAESPAKPNSGADGELVSEKDDEVLCSSCFTLVSQKAIDAEDACPNCGADI